MAQSEPLPEFDSSPLSSSLLLPPIPNDPQSQQTPSWRVPNVQEVKRQPQTPEELTKKGPRKPSEQFKFEPQERHRAKFQLPTDMKPDAYHMSHMIFSDDVIEEYAANSTAYARRRNQTAERISSADILKLFAILMYMGVERRPAMRDYWSTHPTMSAPPPCCKANGMTRDKFMKLW